MAMIEEALPTRLLPMYVDILLEKVAQDANPSIPMLRRIAGLVKTAG